MMQVNGVVAEIPTKFRNAQSNLRVPIFCLFFDLQFPCSSYSELSFPKG